MENESINRIIDPAAFDQLNKLEDYLDKLIRKFIETAAKAQTLGETLSRSNLANYSKASDDSSAALDKMARAQANVERQEIALREARRKAFDDFEKKVQKQIELDNKRAAQVEKNAEKQRQAELKLEADRKKAFDNYEAAMARKAAADEKAAAKIQENSRAYVILSNDLEKARKKAQDFAIAFGENSKQFIDQAKSVGALDARLKAIDATLGKYGRNVGNYSSGWNGLGNSINQITREFPAFTNSIQTGFLAISNNLPTFFDEIKRTQDEIKTLRAQGEKVPGLFQQLTSSVFSWGTALSIGVTLLTMYGKDLVEYAAQVFKVAKAHDYLTETKKQVNDANLKGAKDAQLEIVELKTVYDTAKNVALSSQQRYDAAKKLQDQYPKTFENFSVEQIQLGKVDTAYKKLAESIIATARARASQEKIAENSSRQLENDQKIADALIEYDKQRLIARNALAKMKDPAYSQSARSLASEAAYAEERQAKAAQTIREAKKDSLVLDQRNLNLTNNIVKQQLKGADIADYTATKTKDGKIDSSGQDANKARLEGIKNTAKEIADNEKENFAIRLQALESYQSAAEGIVKSDAQKDIEHAKGHKGQIAAIKAQEASDLEKVAIDVNKMRVDMTDKANKAVRDSFAESEKKEIQSITDSNNDKLELIEKFRAEAAQGVAEQYAAGIISKKQYEETLYEIEKQAALDKLKVQIDATDKIIAIQREDLKQNIGTQKELSDNEKKWTDLKIQYSKLATDAKIKDKERELAKEKEVRDKIIELGQEVLSFTKSLGDGIFTRRQNQIQEEIDANEKKTALDIENVNESVLSEEEKADRIAIINAKADAQQNLLEQKQRQQRIQQAKFDKAAAATSVIANTAVAVMKTYATGLGFFSQPLAIIQGAIGAVQLATVLATPIPKYWNGTPVGGHPNDGLAMVGDGYKHELIIDPDGNMSISPNRPTYTMLKKGTEVIGGDKFERMINYPSQFLENGSKTFDDSGIRYDLNRVEKAIKSTYGSKQPVIIDNGISKVRKWATSKELNNYNYRK